MIIRWFCFCSTFLSFANANFHIYQLKRRMDWSGRDGLVVLLVCISLRAGNSTLQLELLLFHLFSELKVLLSIFLVKFIVLKGNSTKLTHWGVYYVFLVCVCVRCQSINKDWGVSFFPFFIAFAEWPDDVSLELL